MNKLEPSYIGNIIKLFRISGQLLHNPKIVDSFYFYVFVKNKILLIWRTIMKKN